MQQLEHPVKIQKETLETIAQAAIRLLNGTILTGKNHNTIVRENFDPSNLDKFLGQKQGFLTSTGRFVTREEAADIAFNAGQIKNKPDKLIVEDLSKGK